MEYMEGIDSKQKEGGIQTPKYLTHRDVRSKGYLEMSDAEGWNQLIFHLGCYAICALFTSWCYEHSLWGLLLLSMIPFGIVESFLFNGFHELLHNTAFATPMLNTVFAQIVGFFIFRGAKWFWCFHWTHHRYTNDPTKDPELSGESVDLDDPTQSASQYFLFLSGYPFGFERVARMMKIATGSIEADPWVADKPAATQKAVRIEAAAMSAGYVLLGLWGLSAPSTVGVSMMLYWLIPHMFGAGHLRLYQFAEHRACKMGSYTDTNAWICARTTTTWWIYRKLAWQMPWHIEHHAFPNVPFFRLEALHKEIKAAYEKEGHAEIPSGCNPDGKNGYLGLQKEMFERMLKNEAEKKSSKAAKAA
eukprot:TRINITY_DN17770_c0_g1_i1.p1 TRINITY_DN17770_c0_g1~~TRINITY_DN17770_c0_g1_i1.p1  ORF type:complete len:361 (-),score=63.74 TRINITY_DN17770_c0_g1_i1:90-1172(-)